MAIYSINEYGVIPSISYSPKTSNGISGSLILILTTFLSLVNLPNKPALTLCIPRKIKPVRYYTKKEYHSQNLGSVVRYRSLH